MVPRLDPSRPVPDQDLTQVPGFLHHLPVQLGPFLAQGLELIHAVARYAPSFITVIVIALEASQVHWVHKECLRSSVLSIAYSSRHELLAIQSMVGCSEIMVGTGNGGRGRIKNKPWLVESKGHQT